MNPHRNTIDTVLARVRPTKRGCWRWKGAHQSQGYSHVSYLSRTILVHRLLYQHFVGPIPAGLEPDHLCRNRGCVNPTHMELVTHAENARRGQAGQYLAHRKRCPRGHRYAGANLYVSPSGRRACRTCVRLLRSIRRQEQRRTNAHRGT